MVREMTEANLKRAYAGEIQANMRYTVYANRATEEGYPRSMDLGKDVDLGPIQIRQTWGYTVEGDAPNKCPICKAPKERFKSF